MKVEINDSQMDKVNEILEEFNIPIERFMRQAIDDYVNICRKTMEREVNKSDECHTYQIMRNDLTGIKMALKDNNIPYKVIPTDSMFLTTIEAYVSEEDFKYIESIAPNHVTYYPVKINRDMM